VHLICPECLDATLVIVAYVELPADASSDEITLQVAECGRCGARGLAVYEESRRGSEPAWHHTYYDVGGPELKRIAGLFRLCSSPSRSSCSCEVHRLLGRQDADGTWRLETITRDAPLRGRPIRYCP
jgi:hypothetical protein